MADYYIHPDDSMTINASAVKNCPVYFTDIKKFYPSEIPGVPRATLTEEFCAKHGINFNITYPLYSDRITSG